IVFQIVGLTECRDKFSSPIPSHKFENSLSPGYLIWYIIDIGNFIHDYCFFNVKYSSSSLLKYCKAFFTGNGRPPPRAQSELSCIVSRRSEKSSLSILSP